jgi:phenylacetate-CoA ligase
MKLNSYIKNNKILYSWFWKITNRLPKLLGYPRYYSEVYDLLSAYDQKEDLNSILNQHLADILRIALKNVLYYRDLNLGIKPNDITNETALIALSEFPYLEKKNVMDNPRAFISDNYKMTKLMIDTTGGSTGQGIKIFTTARQKFIEIAFSFYEWEKYGWHPTSRVVRMGTDAKKSMSEDPFLKIGDRLLVSPYHINKKWLPVIYRRIRDFKVEYFHSYPSCMFQLTQYMRQNCLKLHSVKGIFLYSEEVPPSWVEIFREVFTGVPILIHYGLSERTNFAWGTYKNGQISYNLLPVYGYSENRFDSDGYPEIVGTTYWNDVMPFIRYRTQDYGLIKDGKIKKIDGRFQSFLITRDGRKVPGISIDLDKIFWEYVDTFQIIQNECGKIEFSIVPKTTFNGEIGDKILEHMGKKWGDLFDIQIILSEKTYQTKSAKQPMIINNILLNKAE